MKRKIIGLAIVILGLVVILGIVYYLFFFTRDELAENAGEQTAQNTLTQPAETTAETSISNQEDSQITNTLSLTGKQETGVNELKRLAGAFAERFGSYSNQSNYGNILDLKLFMTEKMKDWADDYVSQAIAKEKNNFIYYGITTKAIAQEVKQYDEDMGEAEILVATSRREAIGSTANATSFNQNVLITLIKEKGSWKIDSAYWQDK